MNSSRTKKAQRTDQIIIAVLLILLIAIAAFALSNRGSDEGGEAASEVSYEVYNGKKIGILTGTNMEQASFEYFPDSEYLYFDGYTNMNAALENGMIDAYLGEGNKNFFEKLADSFVKNFIRENRWKLILQGIGTTCLITALAGILGTLLAFLICMFRRTGSALANKISNIFVRMMQGTPMVVVLMILYYVFLGKLGMKAVWVAVIGFALNVGAYGSEIMRSGIDSVDSGQMEAALALGFTERQAFFNFVFPQAAVHFLPVYRGELISLLKSTSIVGYISIQDLTKMSDIIRSRTYEAFFPLLATALIYFILAWFITLFMNFLLSKVDWKAGKKMKRKEAA